MNAEEQTAVSEYIPGEKDDLPRQARDKDTMINNIYIICVRKPGNAAVFSHQRFSIVFVHLAAPLAIAAAAGRVRVTICAALPAVPEVRVLACTHPGWLVRNSQKLQQLRSC